MTMTFEEARSGIFAALHAASGLLNDPVIAGRSRDKAADVSFADLDLDSLAAMELCMNVEEDFGITVEPADLALHPSVNALAAALAERASCK
jgi:acyl carrier protein